MNLAYCLAQNTTVCASDLDLQGSLSKFKDITPLQLVTIDEILRGRDEQYAIIDTPPYLSNRLPELINKSDFVLVPVKPGFFDALAVRETLALLKNTNHAMVLNGATPHLPGTGDPGDPLGLRLTDPDDPDPPAGGLRPLARHGLSLQLRG